MRKSAMRNKQKTGMPRRLLLFAVASLLAPNTAFFASKPLMAQTRTWTWESETIDTGGSFPSLAVDKQGNLHVSYLREGKGVMYGFRPAGSSKWFTMVIDSRSMPSNETTGIALDPQENPHICFTPGPLKYSSFDGHEWKTELIGTNTSTLEYTCSVAISSTGEPHIVWYQTHSPDGTPFLHIRYAAKKDGVWLMRTVDFDFETGKWNSIRLDAAGLPHLSYSSLSGGELRYAALNDDKWDVETIDSRNFKDNGSFNRGMGNAIALDVDGNPEISYYNDALLKFTKRIAGLWKTEVVDHVSASSSWSRYRSSIVLDSHAMPHICYEDSGAVKHAVWDGAKWQLQTLTLGSIQSRTPSMGLSADDKVYIAYRDSLDSTLKIAIGTPTAVKGQTSVKASGDH
jgi:hypothetical protein